MQAVLGPPPPARAGCEHLLSTHTPAYKRAAERPEAATSLKSLLVNKRRAALPLTAAAGIAEGEQGREHTMDLTPNPFRIKGFGG